MSCSPHRAFKGFSNEFADIGKEDSPSIEELFSVCCVSVI